MDDSYLTKAAFVEYRDRLHERFGKIHEQINAIEEIAERAENRTRRIEETLSNWRSNVKFVVGLWLLGTILSALLESMGVALWHHAG